MCVRIRGRKVSVEVEPIRNGYFLRSHVNEVFGLQPGSILEVDGSACVVKYLIAGDPGEPGVWAILMPVKSSSSWDPTALPLTQRVRGIPCKRFDRPLLGHMTRIEVEAILDAPESSDWSGRRDRALFTLMYNTGARVSETIGLRRGDLAVGPTASVRIRGKGRKDRCVPLWKATAGLLVGWLAEIGTEDQTPLFPNRHGRAMSRSGVEDRLERAVSVAGSRCSSLRGKNISPHTFRHTTAMHLLQAGVDVTVIALWLGHESPETTHQYVEADVEMKRKVLERLDEPPVKNDRRPKANDLLDFLDGL